MVYFIIFYFHSIFLLQMYPFVNICRWTVPFCIYTKRVIQAVPHFWEATTLLYTFLLLGRAFTLIMVDYLMVVAIDFGTTYAGYGFSTRAEFLRNPLKIHANQAWNSGKKQLLSLKTPTCLLLNKAKELVAFGYEAEDAYAELVLDNKHKDYYYFERFKMRLYDSKVSCNHRNWIVW